MGISTLIGMRRGDGWALLGSCLVGYFVGRLIPNANWAVQAYMLVSYHLFLAYLLVARGKQDKHPIPIAGGVAVHLVFLALIVCLGVFRVHIPYFRLIRYAIAGLAIFERWFLFSANSDPARMLPVQPSDYALTSPAAKAGTASPAPSADAYVAPITGLSLYDNAPQEPQPAAPSPAIPVYGRDTSIVESLRTMPRPGAPSLAPLMTASAQDHEEWLSYLAKRNPTQRKLYSFIDDEYAHWMEARIQARSTSAQASGARPASGS